MSDQSATPPIDRTTPLYSKEQADELRHLLDRLRFLAVQIDVVRASDLPNSWSILKRLQEDRLSMLVRAADLKMAGLRQARAIQLVDPATIDEQP